MNQGAIFDLIKQNNFDLISFISKKKFETIYIKPFTLISLLLVL